MTHYEYGRLARQHGKYRVLCNYDSAEHLSEWLRGWDEMDAELKPKPNLEHLLEMAKFEDEARSVSVGWFDEDGCCEKCGIGFRLPSGVCDHCNQSMKGQ